MARVFISHSSRDNEPAARMKAWLGEQGFETPFLDYDKHAGIPPGADWEKTLYREIERSEAVVIIQTPNWLDSKWCFAEFTQARALGKPIFPIIETPTGDTLISPDIQALDLLKDREGGLEQLSSHLTRIALDAQGGFAWDASRPPYPGLLAFQEEDAALYFGRDDDIRRLIERLNARRAQGGTKLVALLGASGSGKSSLLRAGVIPRLKRAGRNWVVLPPMRPQARPVDELARSLAVACGGDADWRRLREGLNGANLGHTLSDIASDLRIKASANEAQILLPIDQAEELFGASDPDQARRFFEILNVVLSSDQPFIAVMALRSDFLGLLQSADRLTARFEEFSLGPMPLGRIAQIIEGPARVAGLGIDEAFVHQAVRDAETEDALPLLAFALRELYDRASDDNHLSLDEYKALGDPKEGLTPLENAVRKAADDVLTEARPGDEELTALHEAFVPAMVRVNEQGEYVRRPARWDDLPSRSHPLLERLATARLLIVRQDGDARMVEVAHEALLRKWPRLRAWLDDAREFLAGKQQLERDLHDWEREPEADKAGALLTGIKLNRARGWLLERPHQLTARERALVQASVDHADAEEKRRQVEQERRLRDAQALAAANQRTAQRTKIGLVIASVLFVLAGGLGIYALVQQKQAEAAREQAESARERAESQRAIALRNESNLLVAQSSDAVRRNDYVAAAELALRALPTTMANPDRPYVPEAEVALYSAAINLTGDSEVKVLQGHSARVTFAALSPDGTRIITASHDETARLWGVAGANQLAVLGGDDGRIIHAAFSPDGRRVATAAERRKVKVWDTSTGAMLAEFTSALEPGFADAFYFISFSPDGQRLAAVGSGSGAVLWDLSNNQRIATIKPDGFPVHVLFSPDGSRLLTTDRYNGVAALWDARTGAPLTELRGHTAGLYSAQFSRDGSRIVTASADKTARVWNSQSGVSIHTLSGHTDKVFSAEFSQDMKKIVTASKDGTARLWDAVAGAAIATMVGHKGEVRHASFSPDGERIASASRDDTAMIWNTAGKLTRILSGHTGDVTHAVFSHDGKWILTTGDATARLWRLESSGIMIPLHGHTEPVEVAAFSPDGKTVATGAGRITSVGETSVDSTVRLWSVEDGKPLGVLRGHSEKIKTLGFSSDGSLLLSSGYDHMARLWDVQQQRLIRSFKGLRARLSPDGKMIATADLQNAELLDTKSGRSLANFAGHSQVITDLVFSPDGNRLITTSWDQTARLWDLPSGKLHATLTGHSDWVNTATFSPDSKFVVTVAGNKTYYKESDDNTARVWDASTGAPIAVFEGHREQVNAAAFSPDGRLVATASGANNDRTKGDRSDSKDDRVLIWEAATGALRMELKGHSRPVFHVEFSGDGKRLVTASQDFTARVWDVETGVAVAVQPHGSFVNDATFSRDGTRLATASGDEYLEKKDDTGRLWQLFPDTQSLIDHVRGNLDRQVQKK